MRGPLFALAGALALVVAVTTPGLAAAGGAGNDDGAGNAPLSVAVSHADDVTVSVTENGTGVANASVVVTTAEENASYVGVGNHTTDANGTVDLPVPAETVTVDVTASHDDRTATTTETLSAGDRAFGQAVASFVATLQTETDGPIGPTLASWVVANNPGNAPDHVGPPDHAGPGGASNATGDGPPGHAAPGGDGAANETADDGDHADDAGGPPPDAGPPERANWR